MVIIFFEKCHLPGWMGGGGVQKQSQYVCSFLAFFLLSCNFLAPRTRARM